MDAVDRSIDILLSPSIIQLKGSPPSLSLSQMPFRQVRLKSAAAIGRTCVFTLDSSVPFGGVFL